MKVRYLPDPNRYSQLNTNALREGFLVEEIFTNGKIDLLYTDMDRAIVGSAVPTNSPLVLKGDVRSMATDQFAERREIGIINIGSPGEIELDGRKFEMKYHDALYIGRGTEKIEFSSKDGNDPALFYILSYPAHTAYPNRHIKFSAGEKAELGTELEANVRIITKMIYPDGGDSCQLVMGVTEIQPGSVWNTMGAHTHPRRTEIYMYYNMGKDDRMFHFFGKPDETRHLVIKNRQAVISPSWSMHSGAATGKYSFIWGMGGENQDFNDMDFIPMDELK